MKNNSKHIITLLCERGADYPAGTEAKVFRDHLYIRQGRSKTVDVFRLPLPISAEVEDELPIRETPFSAKFKPGLHFPKTCNEPTEIITNDETYAQISAMDKAFIGTENYMGLAYFWSYEFRHTLRDASAADRVRVHAAFLANGLTLNADTETHREIMRALFTNTGL